MVDDYEPTEPSPLSDWVYYAIVVAFVVLVIVAVVYAFRVFLPQELTRPPDALWLQIVGLYTTKRCKENSTWRVWFHRLVSHTNGDATRSLQA
jgi:hypothetical protein